MAQFVLPKEIIAHIISFEPIVAPHSICIKEIIPTYEEFHDTFDTELTFSEFYFWNRAYEVHFSFDDLSDMFDNNLDENEEIDFETIINNLDWFEHMVEDTEYNNLESQHN